MRLLGSALRTSTTEDGLTRREPYLSRADYDGADEF